MTSYLSPRWGAVESDPIIFQSSAPLREKYEELFLAEVQTVSRRIRVDRHLVVGGDSPVALNARTDAPDWYLALRRKDTQAYSLITK